MGHILCIKIYLCIYLCKYPSIYRVLTNSSCNPSKKRKKKTTTRNKKQKKKKKQNKKTICKI